MGGIVGIVAIGGSQFGSTVAGLLTFSVFINLNLAVLNLLPLPPLDGGKILFCLLEKIYQPLTRVQMPVTLAGWAFVLGVMVHATIQDLQLTTRARPTTAHGRAKACTWMPLRPWRVCDFTTATISQRPASARDAAVAGFVIGRKSLKDSQLPDRIVKSDGHVLIRPPEWN